MLRIGRYGNFAAGVVLVLGLALATELKSQERPSQSPPKTEVSAISPEKLPDILAEGAAKLEKNLASLRERLESGKQNLKNLTREKEDLQARIAALNASMAVNELTLAEAQEALQDLSKKEAETGARLKELAQARESLGQEIGEQAKALAAIKEQVDELAKTGHPAYRSPKLQKTYRDYRKLAEEYDRTAKNYQETQGKILENLQAQNKLLTETKTKLEKDYLEKALREELLKRQSLRHRLQQLGQILVTLAAVPGKVQAGLANLIQSGALFFFLERNWAVLLGLFLFLVLLGLGTRRFEKLALPGLTVWQEQAPELGLKVFLTFIQILVNRLFSVGFVAWLYVALWTLGIIAGKEAWLAWSLAAALVSLRLALNLLQQCFAGEETGGVLPIPRTLAAFYRRHLRLQAAYFFLFGFFIIPNSQILGFTTETAAGLRTFFQVVLLGWVLWLLRSRRLDPVMEILPVPAFLKKKQFLRALRTMAFLVFTFVIVSGLLGFRFLSDYVAQGASFTLVVLTLAWIFGESAYAVLRLSLHPERGALAQKYPSWQQFFKKSYEIINQALKAALVAVAVLVSLKMWGISWDRIMPAFMWLNRGPAVGPIRLTPLNLGLAILIIYLGLWVSRLLRSFLELKFYPGRDWDSGIQYTVSLTSHYGILVITGLLALNTMGLSFTSLALVAGGLGVGIGFGLQNIVNNFLSGLILLFERPIKVGDMLVIDGQWGTVKEIRMRSTIFQTFDRYFLIIPNSELISGKILNWTYAGWGLNRLGLKLGVSYDSDPRRVTSIIEEVCRANPKVLAEPHPQVFFEAYGDSSLNFNIWVFLASPSDRISATHELNSAIFEAFQTHSIEIPFPQCDLHVRSWTCQTPPPLSASTSEE